MTTARSRDRKRLRLDLEPEEEAQETKLFINHTTLYLEDGNVILKCGQTLFCVHRSVLSRNSPVLRDLLSALDGGNPEFMRGCLVVSLEDDKEDVEALLNVLYDGFHLDCPDVTIETFPLISSLLRMCTKYRVDRPRNEIIEQLCKAWPSSLADHDKKCEAFRKRISDPFNGAAAADDTVVHPASVIALLRQCEYDSPKLLAPLFYDLSTRTWQFGGPSLGHNLSALSPADVERFVVGLNTLRAKQAACVARPPVEAEDIHAVLAAITRNPDDPELCRLRMYKFWQEQAYPLLLRQNMCTPMEDWGSLIDRTQAHFHGMCVGCQAAILESMRLTREHTWNEMKGIFQLSN